jgi:sigma-B regulation protein RsbU (phosphoserine phosphatase)
VRSTSTNTFRVAAILLSVAAVFGLWQLISNSAHGGIAFFYAVPVGLATWWFGYRIGLVVMVACLGLYSLGGLIQPIDELWFTVLVRLVAFLLLIAAIETLRRRIMALESSTKDLEIIRAALTPAALPRSTGIDVAAAFVPSLHGVSGDFYLVAHPPDGSTVAIVGDVVGHGPLAARLATFVRAQLATFAANIGDPVEILRLANGALIERGGDGRQLVSAVCMHVDRGGTDLEVALAGHPPPLLLPDLGEVQPSGDTSLLGVDVSLDVSTARIALEPSTGVLAYTDGATDLRRDGSLLGLEGLTKAVEPFARLPAANLAAQAKDSLLALGDRPIPDDLCLLVLRPSAPV